MTTKKSVKIGRGDTNVGGRERPRGCIQSGTTCGRILGRLRDVSCWEATNDRHLLHEPFLVMLQSMHYVVSQVCRVSAFHRPLLSLFQVARKVKGVYDGIHSVSKQIQEAPCVVKNIELARKVLQSMRDMNRRCGKRRIPRRRRRACGCSESARGGTRCRANNCGQGCCCRLSLWQWGRRCELMRGSGKMSRRAASNKGRRTQGSGGLKRRTARNERRRMRGNGGLRWRTASNKGGMRELYFLTAAAATNSSAAAAATAATVTSSRGRGK
jgi:hypothetical protein